jgi:hypothetical protein
MKTIGVLTLLLFAAAPARAGAGGDALPFLKMDVGSRGAALSGAYCAAGDDALSVFYNPAGTALAEKKQILLGHNEWLEEIRNETIAYLHPLGPRLTLFGGVNLLMSGSMRRYDAAGTDTGSFSALESAVSLGASAALLEDFYGGAAVKVLSQEAAGKKAMAWAGDAGLLKLYGDWRIGAAVSNFGTGMKLGARRFDLPLMLRGGVSRTFLENYTVSADAVKAGKSETAGAFGAEARLATAPKEYFFIRGGYKTGRSRYAGPGFTAGVGLANRDFRIDYAFAPYGDLGDSHRFTVSLSFGKPRPEWVRRPRYRDLPPTREELQKKPARRAAPAAAPEKGKKKKIDRSKGTDYFMW